MAVAEAVAVAVAVARRVRACIRSLPTSMSAPAALAVFAIFVALDLARLAISRAHGTDEVWTLQQDIRALRASLATATSPRALALAERRERLLKHKERRLARRQTDPKLRRALFVSHYVSVAKALVGCAFAYFAMYDYSTFHETSTHSDDAPLIIRYARAILPLDIDSERLDTRPLFRVQRTAVRSIGHFLAFPHALEWELGAIGVVPWLALSASASVAAARGVVGPALEFAGLMPSESSRYDAERDPNEPEFAFLAKKKQT